MTLNQGATIVVGGVLLAAWLATAAGTGRSADDSAQPAPAVRSALDPVVADIQTQAERLRVRLSAAPAPTDQPRNPFEFAPREPQRPGRRVSTFAPPPEPLPSPASARPVLSLLGIAEDGPANAPVRTAVIDGMGQLFLVKVGEKLTPRFRVERIGADAVEISDLEAGTTFRLGLK